MMIQTPTYRSSDKIGRSASGSSGTGTLQRAPSRVYGTPVSNGKKVSNGHHASVNGKQKKSQKKKSFWSPWRLILISVVIGIVGLFYLTHVFHTQNTLQEVQQLRRQHERAERLHNEARRNYDRMTGPTEVYRRAESLGMVSGGAGDPVIIIRD